MPLRYWELAKLANSRARADWWRTANLMALTANVNRGKRTRAFSPKDFFPFETAGASSRKIPLNKSTIDMLKVFVQ